MTKWCSVRPLTLTSERDLLIIYWWNTGSLRIREFGSDVATVTDQLRQFRRRNYHTVSFLSYTVRYYSSAVCRISFLFVHEYSLLGDPRDARAYRCI